MNYPNTYIPPTQASRRALFRFWALASDVRGLLLRHVGYRMIAAYHLGLYAQVTGRWHACCANRKAGNR